MKQRCNSTKLRYLYDYIFVRSFHSAAACEQWLVVHLSCHIRFWWSQGSSIYACRYPHCNIILV